MSSKFQSRITGEGNESPEQILAHPYNFRRHPKEQLDALEGSLEEIGWIQRVIVNQRTGHLIDGHARVELAIRRDEPEVPVVYVDLSENEEKLALATLDPITGLAYHDEEQLAALLREIEVENDAVAEFLDELNPDRNAAAQADAEQVKSSLAEQFLVPPFTILDARQGYWKDRKRLWLSLGIKSEKGRGQDGEKAGKGGLTLNLSSQPGHVLDRKRELENRDGKSYTWAEFAEAYPEELTLAGDSIFDPVLTEVSYRWFCPPGGKILDPFAGGSVRGIVAAMLGFSYTGIDLRAEQTTANKANWREISGTGGLRTPQQPDDYMPDFTPVERHADHLVKRDDLFTVAGVRGGKVRACWRLSEGAPGLVTAGSRQSPQVNIVANIAARLGVPCRVHTPTGKLSPEVKAARDQGAEIIQHKPGYNSVIIARAREDADAHGYREIPFGMECEYAVRATAEQVQNLPWGEFERIVVPVGSGMNLAGILTGLKAEGRDVPVLGVQVGADPTKRLNQYAPEGWRSQVTLVKSKLDYHDHAPKTRLGDLQLDPVYEAKCLPFLKPGDLLWCVGIRQTEITEEQDLGGLRWLTGDSRNLDTLLDDEQADLVFSCPPYADLEVYSDNPADISNMGYDEFLEAYREIIAKACARLRENRFAVFVVGDVRDKAGFYRNFVSDTIQAFEDAGLRYYNEAIFVTPTGSLAMRAGNFFRASRKLGKAHQNVLVFAKGSPTADDPEQALANYLAAWFGEHRQLLQAHEKLLVFAKGDPKLATQDAGTALIDEPEFVE